MNKLSNLQSMNKKPLNSIAVFLLLLFYFVNSSAQVSKTPTFLWAIFSKGDTVPSFLMGTIHHLGPKRILDNKRLMNIILRSSLIVMEADTSELMHGTNRNFNYTTDTSLQQLLGFKQYQMVKQEFYEATGNQLDDYQYLMPQAILDLITKGKQMKDTAQTSNPLMEGALYAVSRVKNIPVKGLENREEMFNIMIKGMPLRTQAALLICFLEQSKLNAVESQMEPCFQKQDLDCFCQIDDMNQYTRPGDSIVVINRNVFWLPKIEKYLKRKNIFIAIGAAHLCGNFGIIALLKRKGYHLIPIKI
jgi:uncharacterized protein